MTKKEKKEMMEIMEETWKFGLKKKTEREAKQKQKYEQQNKEYDKAISEFNQKAIKLTGKYPDHSIEKVEANIDLLKDTNWKLRQKGLRPIAMPQEEVLKIVFVIVKTMKELKDSLIKKNPPSN